MEAVYSKLDDANLNADFTLNIIFGIFFKSFKKQ